MLELPVELGDLVGAVEAGDLEELIGRHPDATGMVQGRGQPHESLHRLSLVTSPRHALESRA